MCCATFAWADKHNLTMADTYTHVVFPAAVLVMFSCQDKFNQQDFLTHFNYAKKNGDNLPLVTQEDIKRFGTGGGGIADKFIKQLIKGASIKRIQIRFGATRVSGTSYS